MLFRSTSFAPGGHAHHAMSEHQNPLPTTDAVIAGDDGRVVLILRKNEPRGWALPGGFVDQGEELGAACRREALEETGLSVELVTQLDWKPDRDPRQIGQEIIDQKHLEPPVNCSGCHR